MLNLLNNMSRTKMDNIVIVGDFNYNMIDWNLKLLTFTALSPSATEFLNAINDLFLEQLISEPTGHRVGQRSNILDLVLTNNIYFLESIEHRNPIGCNNHISLLLHLKFQENDCDQINQKILYHRGDYEAMIHFIESFDWNMLGLNFNPQESWGLFTKQSTQQLTSILRYLQGHLATIQGSHGSMLKLEK